MNQDPPKSAPSSLGDGPSLPGFTGRMYAWYQPRIAGQLLGVRNLLMSPIWASMVKALRTDFPFKFINFSLDVVQ
ncbi:hypothetical protein SY88_12280 [Clostridiales bacterium PH28_bin88]|nr:hypothetical protein SY88_12280 [Clostridiales bacterium PH28_bin88]